jgi:hypothetical protein
MKARATVAALAAALGLASAQSPARAADPEPEPLEQQPPTEDRAPLDLMGRVRATHDGLSLELAGALVELRMSGTPLPGGGSSSVAARGAHELAATFSVDGKTTHLLLRFLPPPGSDAPESK